MFEWIQSLLAAAAYNTALHSAPLASGNGMYQMKEPEGLQGLAKENKKHKSVKK